MPGIHHTRMGRKGAPIGKLTQRPGRANQAANGPSSPLSGPGIPSSNCSRASRMASLNESKRPEIVMEQFEDGIPGPDSGDDGPDRKSTRLNSSHLVISYAV